MGKMKPEENKVSAKIKTKRKGTKALDNSIQEFEVTHDKSGPIGLEVEGKPVKIKRKKGKNNNIKLFKEEEFDDADNTDPPMNKNEGLTGDSILPTPNKTKKRKNVLSTLLGTKDTDLNEEGFQTKKHKKKKQKPHTSQNAELPKKKNEKQKQETEIRSDTIQPESAQLANLPKKRKNKKKGKVRVQKGANEESTNSAEIERLKFQKTKPNAVKYLLINLIKNVMKKKINMSKNKLKKKVLRKFCRMMEVDEKPEFAKEYEKSLTLTYGIEILEDTVQLKQ